MNVAEFYSKLVSTKQIRFFHTSLVSEADPGFPVGGARTLQGGRQPTTLPNFPKKMHEIENILFRRWGARPRSATGFDPWQFLQ